jgi:hypothetical protein
MQLVFFDIEASAKDGFPIEVGWAVLGVPAASPASIVERQSLLIRPLKRWLRELPWDPAAEALHGIARERLLAEGLPPLDVAERLNERFRGRLLYTDAVWADGAWLDLLFRAAGRSPAFDLAYVAEAARRLPAGRRRAEAARPHSPAVHRAAADAERWALALLAMLAPHTGE